MEHSNMDLALDEVLKSVDYMIKSALSKTTKIYDGLIISNNNDGRWNIQYNGEVHAVKPYGSITPAVGNLVKVFIPQGNQAISFFM